MPPCPVPLSIPAARPAALVISAMLYALAMDSGKGATPIHVFDASSAANVMDGSSLTRWNDVGPGFSYNGSLENIDLNSVSGISETADFVTFGTRFTASYQSDGSDLHGAKPLTQPQSSSIGNGLVDGSVEVWFRTDLENEDQGVWQVLWESGAGVNGFSLLLRSNGLDPAEMRVLKAWNSTIVTDLTVELAGFEGADFIQALVTFDGDGVDDQDDVVRLFVRDVFGAAVMVEDLENDFGSLAGSNDSCAFNAATEASIGAYSEAGGNTGNNVAMSGFAGEIALINFYSDALSEAEVEAAHLLWVDLGDDDGDGMPNSWEALNGFDKGEKADALLDADGDLLNNLGEFVAGTDPRDGDSDGDGLSDGAEISGGSDPLLRDSDGDGLLDGEEVAANPFVTSPILADSDEDLVPDSVELMVGSDPTNGAMTAATLLIGEFMASNGTTLEDEDGDSSDWIELVNGTGAELDLGGYHLTDDPLAKTKWTIPGGTLLGPGEFLVVFASGKDRSAGGNPLHTNFSLEAAGEYLALVAADGLTVIQEFVEPVPKQEVDVSFDLDGNYRTVPSPGDVNLGPGVSGFVADTKFSMDRGFYDAPFVVEISTVTEGATIVYTTDSTTPSLTNGVQVLGSSASVQVTGTTILRAMAFKEGLAPTNVDTQTYLFLTDVVTQSDDPGDYEYPNWNNLTQNRSADYGMDLDDVVGVQHSSQEVIDSLLSLPTISIATDAVKLFDREVGNYANSQKGGREWEREVSMELFGGDLAMGAQINGGLRLAGNASRSPNRRKHNMRIVFRREYGAGTLEFPLFNDSDVTSFNSIQLRGGNGDSWVHPQAAVRNRAAYLRDQWHRDVHVAMEGSSQVQRYAHLYLNGLYWGVFHIFERIENDYMVEHFGGREEDWDVRDHIGTFNGTEASWTETFAIADDPVGMADPENYAALQGYVDLEDFIDYLLVHFYSNSDDWDQNNLRAARNRVEPDTWKFFCWDQERTLLNSLGTPSVNGATALNKDTNSNTRKGPTHVHQQLRASAEYRIKFADRVRKHCFHDGALTPVRAGEIWDDRASEVRAGMIAESARWGDLHQTSPHLVSDWEGSVLSEKAGWFDLRTPILIGLLQGQDLYPMTEAPEYLIDGMPQFGGPTPSGALLEMTAPGGVIYYTLDGSDPRAVGGAVQGEAFMGGVVLNQPVTVKARVLEMGEWSALSEAQFSVGTAATAGNLVVSELMYEPVGASEAEFIELMNISEADTIDLTGVRFTDGIEFDVPDNTIIPAGGRLLIVRNRAVFESVHGIEVPVLGEFANLTALSNGGERIVLEDALGVVIQDFTYETGAPWPTGANGGGSSLVLIDPWGAPDHGDPASWRSSVEVGGNPGDTDVTSYASWAAANGVVDPEEDVDGDGMMAIFEYFAGTDEGDATSFNLPEGVLESVDGETYLLIHLVRQPGRDDAEVFAQRSIDLETWLEGSGEVELVRNVRNPDGTETLSIRSLTPLSVAPVQFLRLAGSVRP